MIIVFFFFIVSISVTERAMQWQARVRQALKRKDIEAALLEFSLYQQKQPKSEPQGNNKDHLSQEKKGGKKSTKGKQKIESDILHTSDLSDDENEQ